MHIFLRYNINKDDTSHNSEVLKQDGRTNAQLNDSLILLITANKNNLKLFY